MERKHFILFICATILVSSTSSSCRKKIIEIIPVIEITKDLSVPNGGNIKFFDFPTENLGFAASDTNFIFRTQDGGITWEKIEIGFKEDECRWLCFFDVNAGLCQMLNRLYRTTDGGHSWNYLTDGDRFCVTEDGKVIKIDEIASTAVVSVSSNQGLGYQHLTTFNITGEIVCLEANYSSLYIATDDSPDAGIYKVNLVTGTQSAVGCGTHVHNEYPNGMYSYGDSLVQVTINGAISDNFTQFTRRKYYFHNYTFWSVDGWNGKILCVGQRTMASNLETDGENEWYETLGADGNGFSQTFYNVEFINVDEAYVSGSNGLIWKIKL